MKKIRRLIFFLFLIVGLIVGCSYFYLKKEYKADNYVNQFMTSTETVEVTDTDLFISFTPKQKFDTGIIFYQGAQVDENAYNPLLFKLAEKGYMVINIKFPFNLALFRTTAALDVKKECPDIDFYLMGHSLGGAMASSCLSENIDDFLGIILLASYSTKDIKASKVLSIYGANDKVLNMKKYDKYKTNLPSSVKEFVIQGGNHSGFAYYGDQKGDGNLTISRESQIKQTINSITNFIA